MKVEFCLLILFLYLNIRNTYCQGHIQAFHFKPNRNADFAVGPLGDVPLGDSIVVQDLNGKPEYCCGDIATERDGMVIVNNASTFQQWFTSSIDPNTGFCHNYGLLLEAEFNFGYGGTVSVNNIVDQLDGRGFNNATEFPDEVDDYKNLFCWYTQVNAAPIIPATRDIGFVFIDTPGEVLLYQDGKILLEIIGTGIPTSKTLLIDVGYESSKLEFFGCSRSGDMGSILIGFSNLDIFCTEFNDLCDTCGPAESCFEDCSDDDPTKCIHPQAECGVCNYNKIRNCDDSDPCTLDYCVEGEGCLHDPIDGCEGCVDDENCITQDLCYPKRCVDQLCIQEPIQCYSNDTCFEPVCVSGQCICSSPPPTSTGTTATTTTTTDTTTSGSTIATTTASTIATTTSQTTDTLTTIATTTASTIATTTSQTTDTLSTISSSSLSTSTSSTSSASSTTNSPSYLTQCNSLSCPHHYCCIQLNLTSYTCVSKYFDENCSPDRLKLFK